MKDGLEKMRSHEGSYGNTNPAVVLSETEILKNKIYSFARELSVIGLRYIADRNQSMIRRLSWAVLITFGFGFAVYQINDRIQFYLSFSTTTDIEMVQADQLEFPQVTICNENPVRKSVAEDLGKNFFSVVVSSCE